MNTALREGLVEIEAAIPTFATSGLEERAVAIGRIAGDSYEYIAGLLGFRPAIQLRRSRSPSQAREPEAGAQRSA